MKDRLSLCREVEYGRCRNEVKVFGMHIGMQGITDTVHAQIMGISSCSDEYFHTSEDQRESEFDNGNPIDVSIRSRFMVRHSESRPSRILFCTHTCFDSAEACAEPC